jgi:small subunit ribosomal protein S16
VATTIRLQRTGRKRQASFRIVVTDVNEQRDGPAIETLGIYNPRTQPSVVRLDAAAALNWLYEGAQPTDTVVSIFRKTGVWQKFQAGERADSLAEPVVTIGPPPGERKTSLRAAIAAEAQKQRAAEVAVERQAAEAAAAKDAARAEKEAEAAAVVSEEPVEAEVTAEEAAAVEETAADAPEAEEPVEAEAMAEKAEEPVAEATEKSAAETESSPADSEEEPSDATEEETEEKS